MRFRQLVLAVLCASSVALATVRTHNDNQLSVSAAISLRDVLKEAAEAYRKEKGRLIEFNFGASGELATQIQQGAPVDLFISASQKQVDDLIESGEVDKESPRSVIARNALVLIVPSDAAMPPAKFEDLADPKLADKIAIGDPKSVPAGQYAMEVFDSLKITDAVRNRLVTAANVRQVLGYVERGEVAAGVVYQTDAMLLSKKVTVVAVAHQRLHSPIEYPAVVIKGCKHSQQATEFAKFLQSDKAKAIFKAKGFITP